MTVSAKYEAGVFKPLEDVNVDEGTVVQVYIPQGEVAKPLSIRQLGFTGMWAYREDIADGLDYVDRYRVHL